MADNQNSGATKPAATLPAPAAVSVSAGIRVTILRDYWPKGDRPADLPEDQEYRVRAGETVVLPAEEAMDVVEAGAATRTKG